MITVFAKKLDNGDVQIYRDKACTDKFGLFLNGRSNKPTRRNKWVTLNCHMYKLEWVCSPMKTIYEITLKILVTHDKENPLVDSNSVKGAINAGVMAITDASIDVYGESDGAAPDRVQVEIGDFKENGKFVARSTFGTDAVPFCGGDTML